MEIDLKVLRSLVRRGNNGHKNAFTKLLVMAKNEELRREIEEARKKELVAMEHRFVCENTSVAHRVMRGLGV